MRVLGVSLSPAMAGTVALLVGQEQLRRSTAELLADLKQGHHLPTPCGALDLELITIVVVVALQGLDDEVVHWIREGWDM